MEYDEEGYDYGEEGYDYGDDEYGDKNIYGDDAVPEYDIETEFSEEAYMKGLSSGEYIPEMKMDIKAFERVGTGQVLGTDILPNIKGQDYKDIISSLKRRGTSPYETFKIYVNVISLKYIEDNIIQLSPADIRNLLEYIPLVDRPQYKNPHCYILGYVGANIRGNKSNPTDDSIKKAISLVKKINKEGIYPPDVLRYITLWQNLII